MNDDTPHGYLESHVAEILRADSWFAEHRVEIIEQNSATLAEIMSRAAAEATGISMVISYDKEEEIHAGPPQLEVEFSLLLSEFPATNRENDGWTTAMDAAHRARRDLEAADKTLIYRDTTHTTPEYGMLVATARFHTRLVESD